MTQETSRIGTHEVLHLDEYKAIYLARHFGLGVWPGIGTAKVVTKDGGAKMYNYADMIYIGIGEGQFDEHGSGKDTSLCCADLIARHLGIERLPKVSLILDKVRLGDRQGKYMPLDLGYCIRMLNHLGWSPSSIEAWLKVFFDCYYDDRTVIKNDRVERRTDTIEFPVSDKQNRDLNTLFARWLKQVSKKKTAKEMEILSEKLCRDLATINKREPSRVFDIMECASLISAYHPGDAELIYHWVKPIFDACLKFQADFLEACKIIKAGKTMELKPYKRCDPWDIIQMLGIDRRSNHVGNRCLLSAAKFLNKNLDVLVLQQPTGNVQIFILRNHRYHLLPMIARAIRLEEIIACDYELGEVNYGYDFLASSGRLDYPEQWYLATNDQGDGFALFNGSLTLPNIKPTLIFFDQIVEIVSQMVLTPDEPYDWNQYADRRIKTHRQVANLSGNKLSDVARFK